MDSIMALTLPSARKELIIREITGGQVKVKKNKLKPMNLIQLYPWTPKTTELHCTELRATTHLYWASGYQELPINLPIVLKNI